MSGLWGPDVFNPVTRGNNFITALHKLDHDREQVRTDADGFKVISTQRMHHFEVVTRLTGNKHAVP